MYDIVCIWKLLIGNFMKGGFTLEYWQKSGVLGRSQGVVSLYILSTLQKEFGSAFGQQTDLDALRI